MQLRMVGLVTPPRLLRVIVKIVSFPLSTSSLYDNDPENDVRLPSFLSSSTFFVRFCHILYHATAPHSPILDKSQCFCRMDHRRSVFLHETPKYYTDISSALTFYEHLITLSEEVQVIWCRKFTGATLLFLVNRYLTLLTASLILVTLTMVDASVSGVKLLYFICNHSSHHRGKFALYSSCKYY